MNNTFTSLLTLLDVRHTSTYSSRLYNEHPHKNNLYGLSKMLSEYNIKNAGIKFSNKEADILKLEAPFIAHVGGNFVAVSKITTNEICYIWQEKEIALPVNEFCKLWSGITLLAEPNEESDEPDYLINHRHEQIKLLRKVTLIGATFILLALTFISKHLYNNIGSVLLCILNFIGIYISYLLVLKQIKVQSSYADRICSLFSQKDCNNVLESEAAKLAGIIGWSEIGLAYFISNTIITFFLPDYITYLALVNIIALPYTLWSIWYQKFRTKQWCPLCLIIQALLWSIFIIDLCFGFIHPVSCSISDILLIGLLYLIPIPIINIIVSKFNDANKLEEITQELNSIKASEDIFSAILKQQPHYDISLDNSNILLGNPKADILVTVLTNPHCNPCAKMHFRIEKLLEEVNHLCIQYIFSSFNPDLDSSSKFLSAVYFYKAEATEIYNRWFEKGKLDKENFFKTYISDLEGSLVLSEFEKHNIWKAQTGLYTTPTILINGYKLPDSYKIEDLKYITEIK